MQATFPTLHVDNREELQVEVYLVVTCDNRSLLWSGAFEVFASCRLICSAMEQKELQEELAESVGAPAG